MDKKDYIAKHKRIKAIASTIEVAMDTIADLVSTQTMLIVETVGEPTLDGLEGVICKEQLEYAMEVNRQLALFTESESGYYN